MAWSYPTEERATLQALADREHLSAAAVLRRLLWREAAQQLPQLTTTEVRAMNPKQRRSPPVRKLAGCKSRAGEAVLLRPILPPVRAAVKTRADRDQAADLLAVLGLDRGLIQVKCFDRASKLRLYWYELAGGLAEGLATAGGNEPGRVRCLLRSRDLRGSTSGTKDKTAWLWTVHADLDGKDYAGKGDWRTGKPLSLDMIANLPDNLQPAVLVDTGHGIHAYWPLR
ncbi:MAG: hypothetical protein V9H69_24140 [Anaerolineae bacterium]